MTDAISRNMTSVCRGRSETTFQSRGQTFIGKSKKSERLLNQFCEIRSSVEQIKDIMPRVRQAEGISNTEVF